MYIGSLSEQFVGAKRETFDHIKDDKKAFNKFNNHSYSTPGRGEGSVEFP